MGKKWYVFILLGLFCLTAATSVKGITLEPTVYLIVNSSICDQLESCLATYTADLNKIGLKTTIVSFKGGNCSDIKNILISAYHSQRLVGCLFVGDLPTAWYEDYGLGADNETYPCDLFFMDLNGNWTDSNGNGIFDQHSGNRSPEIWVGRLKVPEVMGNETLYLKKYFEKDHRYRNGDLVLPNRSLLYIDDDWSSMDSSQDLRLSLAYQDRVVVSDNKTTCATDYLNRLSEEWNFVWVMAHGFQDCQIFAANKNFAGTVTSEDIRSADPHVFFYDLFSCHTGNYTAPDYLAGSYIFGSNYSLALIAPTDKGGTLILDDFFSNLSQKNLGDSFLQWLRGRITDEEKGFWYGRRWFYGLTIIGDPTLSLLKPEIPQGTVLLGDVNNDGVVNIIDLTKIALVFGKAKGVDGFDSVCDLNEDGIIDILDLAAAAHNFGKSIPISSS